MFGLNGSVVDLENPTTLLESYNDLAADIAVVVEEGYPVNLLQAATNNRRPQINAPTKGNRKRLLPFVLERKEPYEKNPS